MVPLELVRSFVVLVASTTAVGPRRTVGVLDTIAEVPSTIAVEPVPSKTVEVLGMTAEEPVRGMTAGELEQSMTVGVLRSYLRMTAMKLRQTTGHRNGPESVHRRFHRMTGLGSVHHRVHRHEQQPLLVEQLHGSR